MSKDRDFRAAAAWIRKHRAANMSFDAIAKWLMNNNYLTKTGKKVWGVQQVWAVMNPKTIKAKIVKSIHHCPRCGDEVNQQFRFCNPCNTELLLRTRKDYA